MRKHTALFAALICVACPLGDAVAQPAPSAPAAASQKEAFAEAQKLFDEKDYAAALPKFEALFAETQSPNARLYVARSLRELGRIPEAYDEMAATVKDATARAAQEAKYEGTRDAAAAELAVLEGRVAHLTIAVADATDGTKVLLNGVEVPTAKLAAPITVVPGPQRIEIVGPDFEPVRREIEVAGGETKTLPIAVRAGGAGTKGGPEKPGPAKADEQTGGELRIVGIVAACLGGASLVTFGVTAGLSDAKFSTLEEECGGARCTDPKYADVVDEGKTLELIANVTVIAGSVLAAASIPLIIWGGPTDAEPAATAALAPVPGGAVVRVGGSF